MIELYNLATDPNAKNNLATWQKQLGAKMPVPNPDYDPNAKPKPRKPKEKK